MLHAAVDERLRVYDGIAPEWFKEQYLEEQKEARERRRDNVTYYNANNDRSSTNVQKLLDNKKYIFYVDRNKTFKHKNTVEALYDSLDHNFKRNTKLIFLAATAIKKLKKYDSIVDFDEIFRLPNSKLFL